MRKIPAAGSRSNITAIPICTVFTNCSCKGKNRLRRNYMETKRLTERVSCAGCAAKLPPHDLAKALATLPSQSFSKNLLVGFDTSDDAGVFQISEDLALVQTVDFFTPIADDPATFGRIAANNSLNDVYAMGGVPLTALSVTCYPRDEDKIGRAHV